MLLNNANARAAHANSYNDTFTGVQEHMNSTKASGNWKSD